MTEAVRDPQAIARHACERFAPILEQWAFQDHPEPSLAVTVQDKCAARILEQDFRDVGIYLISSDDRGTRIELGVLVDSIAELRRHSTQSGEAVSAGELEREFELVRRRNAGSSFLPPPMVLNMPLCLRVARDLQRHGIAADAEGLKDLLVEFVHRIVIQDGNVTDREIAVAKEIEESLTDMIRNAV